MTLSTDRYLFFPIVLLLWLWSAGATAQVTADFNAPVTSGCSPLIVNFQNLSTGAGLTYQWNLGNGNNSTAQNPSASYITPGTYTVTLTVTGPGGTDTEVKNAFITVFTPPTPNISASQNTGCFPFPVDFSDISTPGDSPVASWSWDFGDGGTSTAQNPTHSYTTSGTFGVTLLLVDANGCASNQTFPGFITSNSNRPFAGFSSNLQVGCIPPVDVTFANLSFGGTGPLTYTWDFGDGTTSATTAPVHTYTAEGVFDVSLTVTDQLGCSDTEVLDDHITIVEDVVIDFSVPSPIGCLGTPVPFTDLSFPQPTSWLWDFGDGTTSTDENPSHLYTSPGDYTVTLTSFYAGSCQGTEVKTDFITVGGIPFASFTPDQTAGCETPFPVTFENFSVGATSYAWDFGDGGTSASEDPSHVYLANGVFNATLTATNDEGCTSTQTIPINITQTAADFLPDVFGFCQPLEVNFSDSSASATPIVSYQWDFGDGNTSTLPDPTHVYADTGRYDVSLIIVNDLGCTDTLVRTNYIFVYTPPVADFVQTPVIICPGEFEFTNLSTGPQTGWFWDFGDETTDVVQNPIHNYSDTGFFSITLVTINNGCTDTLRVEDMIYVSPPIAGFTTAFDCTAPNTFTFTNTSIEDDTYEWSFGDGVTNSTDTTVTYVYAAPGEYYVDLDVTNASSGCTDNARDTIYVTQLNAAFTPSITQGCAPLEVTFTDNSTDAVAWNWNFGNGSTSILQHPVRTYTTIGTFTVRLIVTDINGCQDTVIMNDLITTTGALVAFEVDTAYGCDDLTVEFNDLTTPVGSIVSWLWDFGDGSTSTAQNPTNVFNGSGNYNVTLTTTDNAGCVNTTTVNNAVDFTAYPTPAFTVDNALGCVGDVFQFTNASTPDAVSFVWDFGDGTTSVLESPTHSYSAIGTYSVSLTAVNANGCDSTVTQVAMINIDHPEADFSAFPTFAFCPPLLVSFTDASEDAVSWLWDFGNGSTSTIQNPSHIYTESGIYTVRLVVTNVNGCTDTLIMPDLIELSGPSGDFTFFPDTVGCPPYDITYVSNTTNATNYTWDFGDGALGSGSTATHTYFQLGAYIPTLILQDANGCTFTYQSADTLRVVPLGVDAGQDVVICENNSVVLGASGGDTYSWFPPIGLSDPNAASPVASPTVTTSYIVTVQLLACQNTDTVVVFVNPSPDADFTTQDVCFGTMSQFLDNSAMVAPDSIVSWSWDLEGTLSTDTNPSNLYASAGTYDISLVVESNSGCTDTAQATVVVNPAPIADFIANDTCLFQPTFFTDMTTVPNGTVSTWQWDLGNGSTSVLQNPDVVYSEDTTYMIVLVVTAEGGCTDTAMRPVNVFPLPQVELVAEDVCLGEEVAFGDSSDITLGTIVEWQWSFGDGDSSTVQHPTHTYTTAQAFVYSLAVVSSEGCVNSGAGTVNVRPLPISNFDMTSTQSCFVPVTVNFFDQSLGAATVEWDFDNGQTVTTNNASAQFDTIGQFNVQLLVTSQFGCQDSSVQLFQVFPTVIANFTWSDPVGCQPWSVDFENTSTNGLGYSWDFEDVDGSLNMDPTHIFEEPGDYTVTLIVDGEGGCGDTITYNDIITVFANPEADFEYIPVTEPVLSGIIVFNNTSTPSFVSNWWDFGDGTTSANFPATHQYDFYGSKLVTLAIVDANGCVDTISRYVTVDFFGTLFVPNAMVVGDPDPQASIFLPKGRGLSSYRCIVFDEWGNKLWETTALENGQPSEGWDGHYKGEPVPQGAYAWKIDGLFTNGSVWEGQDREGVFYQAGTVTVIR